MMHAGEGISACGTQWSLQAFTKWPINAEPAGVVEGASRVRWSTTRSDLAMPKAKIAPLPGARKWYTAYSQRKNSLYNLNDSPRVVCERLSYAVPSSLAAEPRAIPHAQSPKDV